MTFSREQLYSRADIGRALGGNLQSCLVTSNDHVVAVCFKPDMNPRGPERIYVGMGKFKEKAAALLATQKSAVPVFRKAGTNTWRYLGLFVGENYSEEGKDIAVANRETGRTHIAGVLSLRSAE